MVKTIAALPETIVYKVVGNGSPLVFLHGFLEDSSIWSNIEHELHSSHKIITIDLPGHGKSTCNNRSHTMASMAKIIQQICSKEKLENPIVFGHSMGGYVALELAKIYKIDIALIHSNFWADSIEKKMDRNRVIKVVQSNLPLFLNTAIPNLFFSENRMKCQKQIEKLIASGTEMKVESVITATQAMRDRENNFKVVQDCKVAIIQGEKDSVFSKKTMLEKINLLSEKPHYIELESCGHMGFAEQPQDFLKAIERIIGKFLELKAFN